MKMFVFLLGLLALTHGGMHGLSSVMHAAPNSSPKMGINYTVVGFGPIAERQLLDSPIPYYTEYFVVNQTRKPILVGHPQSPRAVLRDADIQEVQRHDTLRAGEYMGEDDFGGWEQRLHFQLNARKPKWLQGVAVDMKHPTIVSIDVTHRRCYFFITKTKMPFY